MRLLTKDPVQYVYDVKISKYFDVSIDFNHQMFWEWCNLFLLFAYGIDKRQKLRT